MAAVFNTVLFINHFSVFLNRTGVGLGLKKKQTQELYRLSTQQPVESSDDSRAGLFAAISTSQYGNGVNLHTNTARECCSTDRTLLSNSLYVFMSVRLEE